MDQSITPKYRKVMVIDDTEVDRYIAQHVIKKSQFAGEIIPMESAQKALDFLKQHSGKADELPELIFLDIRMPEIDGFGFLEKYEGLPESVRANCIIMMLTTSLDPSDHLRAAENQFVRKFLNKPLDKQKLSEI